MIEGSVFEHTDVEECTSQPDGMYLSTSPNPFNSTCEISWGFDRTSQHNVGLSIYDMAGKEIERFEDLPLSGYFNWIPDDNTPSGLYLVKVRMGFIEKMRKINYVK